GFTGDGFDDNVITRNLPTTGIFRYFGTTFTTADVSYNGNVNFSFNGDFANIGLPGFLPRISPLWDDLNGSSVDRVSDVLDNQADPVRKFYAVTWSHVSNIADNPNTRYTFQLVWFGADMNLQGFNFHAGDIAFDYTDMSNFFETQGGNPGATVGV